MKTGRLKSLLKNFFTFWKPTISRRLTFSFTVFGLVIGYAVFIFFAITSTNTFIKLTSDSIQRYLESVSKENMSDNQSELLEVIDQRLMGILNEAKAYQRIFPDLKFDLYFQNDGTWRHTYLDKKGAVQSEKIKDPEVAGFLEKTKVNRILRSSPVFYGARDTVNVKINISPMGSKYTQIVSFDIQRAGFFKIIRDNIYKSIIFFCLLLLVSRALGQIFSARLSRPIEQLSQEAEIIASGQYDRRFTIERRDEIGKLAEALNSMASRIIDGTKERENLLIGILIALTRAIDAKSPWTAGHSERVTRFAEDIGRNLDLNEDQMQVLTISAILHDVGKIAVPEQILDKPGKLTDEEFAVVKKHPQAGADIISSIPSYDTILPGILHHHERWDGTGYPQEISGKDIPLFARIICIADVYDALTEDRPYRKAWSKEHALRFFKEQKEKMFDPELVDIFLKLPGIRE